MPDEPDEEQDFREDATAVLGLYDVRVARLERIEQGLINQTFTVHEPDGGRYILQCLNPVFHRSVNLNIDAVTRHLAARKLLTPLLVRTAAGDVDAERRGRVWRMLTFVEGRAWERLPDTQAASSAGQLLARFHGALVDFDGRLSTARAPVHDIERHLDVLSVTLGRHPGHRLLAPVRHEEQRLRDMHAGAPSLPPSADRLVHGDPKISNILFEPEGSMARCLIDLDTLAAMPLALELGDAFRSWCNPVGEDAADARFDLGIFEAAVSGYAQAARMTPEERRGVVPATLLIHLELAARFLADALGESYFAWNAARYPGRGEHNLARARGQLAAASSLRRQLPQAQAIVRQRLGCTG